MLLDIALAIGLFDKTDHVFIKLLLFVFPYFIAKGVVQHHIAGFRLVPGDPVRHGFAAAGLGHVHAEEVVDEAALAHTGAACHKDAGLLYIFADLVQHFVVIKILEFIN